MQTQLSQTYMQGSKGFQATMVSCWHIKQDVCTQHAKSIMPRRERLWEIRQVQVLSPKHLVSPMEVLRTLLWYNGSSVLKREMLT